LADRETSAAREEPRAASPHSPIVTRRDVWKAAMLKVIGWIVGIIFLIGLLVVFGIFDLIF
jgi:hypothetical protein